MRTSVLVLVLMMAVVGCNAPVQELPDFPERAFTDASTPPAREPEPLQPQLLQVPVTP